MNKALQRLGIFLSLVIAFHVSWGQGSTTSTMNGRITNAEGEILENATVVAIHQPTGTRYGVLSNSDGYFRIPNMNVGGPYKVTVTFVGYSNYEVDGIFLILGQTYKLNPEMSEEATVLDEVLITSVAGNVFDGNRTGAETYISEKTMQNLPTVNRDFLQDFGRITPQANLTNGGLSISGVNNRYNAIFIDGAVNNDVFGLANTGTNGGQAGITPISPDALEQVQVVVAPYDVKLGGFAGGGVNAVTRSGTNTLEGSAYYFLRNENLTGKTPGDIPDSDRTKLAPFTAKTYGFRLGGPIIKDKLFFFTNVEIQRDEEPKPFTFADYQGTANAETLSELESFLASEYGYDPGGYENNISTRDGTKILAKLDWNISNSHKLSLRHSYVKGEERDASRSSNRNIFFFNSGVLFPTTTNSFAAELKSVFSDRVSNNLVFGVTTVRDDRDILGDPFPQVRAQDGDATVIFGTDNFSYSNIVFQDVYTLTNNLTINSGRHNFTFGTHNEFFKIQNLFAIFSTPRYFYNNSFDDNGNLTQTGLEAFLAGAPAFALFGHEQPTTPGDAAGVRFGDEGENLGPTFNAMQLSFYAQDEWEVTNDFKLTLGLRADIPVFLDDPPLDNTEFNNTTIPRIEAAGYDLKGARASQAPKTQIMLAPRIGFNWDVNGESNTQIRGGVGVFTSRVPWVWPGGMFIRNGLNSSFSGVFGPFQPKPEDWRNLLNLDSPSGDVDLFVEDFKYPQIFRTSLAVDQKLPGGFVLTLEGLYTKTLNDIDIKNVNLRPTTETLTGADNRPIFDPNDPIDDTYSYITLVDNTNKGYTANITAQIQKTFSENFIASLAYSFTRAEALFDGFGFINSTNWRENQSIFGRNNATTSRTIFDTGSRISGFFSRRFNYGGEFGGATTISLFYNGQSGQPYSYVYQNGELLTNEDNQQNVTLMYVPRSQDEIVFADQATAAQQWSALDAYIEADDYLSTRRGQYAERNMSRTPFESLFDLKIAQDISLNLGQRRHTIQVTFDLFNVANFLNPKWGASYFVGNRGNFGLVRFVGFQEGTNTPTFAFDPPTGDVWTLSQTGFRSARWYSQFGLRYLF